MNWREKLYENLLISEDAAKMSLKKKIAAGILATAAAAGASEVRKTDRRMSGLGGMSQALRAGAAKPSDSTASVVDKEPNTEKKVEPRTVKSPVSPALRRRLGGAEERTRAKTNR
tara:strand:+ start:245 stop:589 length:345 start_codon:yes stop_codon:yes gene_type:complete